MLPQRFDWRHLFVGEDYPGMASAAFPEEIPMEIRKNHHAYRQPYPCDHGIRFEPSKSAARLGLISPETLYDHLTLECPEQDVVATRAVSQPRKSMKGRDQVTR